MTIPAAPAPHAAASETDASPWQRLLTLSGVAFVDRRDLLPVGSPFGYGFFPGGVALVIGAAAASIATYRSAAR